MSGVYSYSTNPANNGVVNGQPYFPEGMLPAALNDAQRQVMADIASFIAGPIVLTGAFTNQGPFVAQAGVSVDAQLSLSVVNGNPILNFDANDFLTYDRAQNKLILYINSTPIASIDNGGNLRLSGQVYAQQGPL